MNEIYGTPKPCDGECNKCHVGDICPSSPHYTGQREYVPMTEDQALEAYPHVPPVIAIGLCTLRDKLDHKAEMFARDRELQGMAQDFANYSLMASSLLGLISDAFPDVRTATPATNTRQ